MFGGFANCQRAPRWDILKSEVNIRYNGGIHGAPSFYRTALDLSDYWFLLRQPPIPLPAASPGQFAPRLCLFFLTYAKYACEKDPSPMHKFSRELLLTTGSSLAVWAVLVPPLVRIFRRADFILRLRFLFYRAKCAGKENV